MITFKKPFRKGALVYVIDERVPDPIKGKVISSTNSFCFIKISSKSFVPNGSLISLDGENLDTILVNTNSVIKKNDLNNYLLNFK